MVMTGNCNGLAYDGYWMEALENARYAVCLFAFVAALVFVSSCDSMWLSAGLREGSLTVCSLVYAALLFFSGLACFGVFFNGCDGGLPAGFIGAIVGDMGEACIWALPSIFAVVLTDRFSGSSIDVGGYAPEARVFAVRMCLLFCCLLVFCDSRVRSLDWSVITR